MHRSMFDERCRVLVYQRSYGGGHTVTNNFAFRTGRVTEGGPGFDGAFACVGGVWSVSEGCDGGLVCPCGSC